MRLLGKPDLRSAMIHCFHHTQSMQTRGCVRKYGIHSPLYTPENGSFLGQNENQPLDGAQTHPPWECLGPLRMARGEALGGTPRTS